MSKLIIDGGEKLYGDVTVKGAKNSVLPLLAATLLTDDITVLHNCPRITDVQNMCKILVNLGCKITFENDVITVDSSGINNGEIPSCLAKELRSSLFLLGSLLTKIKCAKVAYPGGCDIGMRPIDIHLKALRELNVDIDEKYGFINCKGDKLIGADIILDLPSVGATENVMMAAVKAEGRTVIRNAAKEPEILDLQNFLNMMGARIRGAGSSCIVIDGVSKLHGAEYTPIPDRITAGTYILSCAMCGGEIVLHGACYEHIFSLISKLSKTACNIKRYNDKILVKSNGRLKSVDNIETMYYPGFPTDLQAQLMSLESIADGSCIVVENIFETRFKHVPELLKMGADITVKGRAALIKGVEKLRGTEVLAQDLRGGAALVMAGLSAEGKTVVSDIYHIDRGYESIEKTFSQLGAKIYREQGGI